MHVSLKKTFIFIIIFYCSNINAQQDAYTEYYDNGKIKAVGFKSEQDINYGKWIYYRKDGSIDSEITFNKQGKTQGPFLMYYRNGQIQAKGNYSNEGFYEMDGNYEDY